MTNHSHSRNASAIPNVLRDFVRNNHVDAMALVDGVLLIEYNDVLLNLMGYESRDEVLYKSILNFLTEDSVKLAESQLAKFYNGNYETESIIYNAIKKDGSIIQIETSIIPWPSEKLLYVMLIKDVTKREQGIESLKESEHLYHMLCDTMPAGIILIDKDDKTVYANKAASKITGYSLDEILENTEILQPADEESANIYMASFRTKDPAHSKEIKCKKKDGTYIWLSISWQPIIDSHSQIEWMQLILNDVTERRQVEDALREQQSFFRRVIDNVSEFICVKDNDGSFVLANRKMAESYGTDIETLEGSCDSDFSPTQEEFEAFRRDDSLVISSRKTLYISEEPVTFADGSVHWMSTVKTPLIEEDGSCDRLLVVAIDITERKLAVDALRASEERFRTIFESSLDSISIIDKDLNYLYANKASFKNKYIFPEEKNDLNVYDTLSKYPEIREIVLGRIYKVFDSGQPSFYEDVTRFHSDVYYSELEILPIKDASEKVIAVAYIYRDVTQKKLAERKIIDSEAQFRAIFDAAAIGIGLVSKDGNWLLINKSMQNIIGYTMEELQGKPWHYFTHPDDIEPGRSPIEELLAGKSDKYQSVRRYIHKEGKILRVRLTASVVRDANYNVQHAIAMVEDITKRKVTEDALLESQQFTHSVIANAGEPIVVYDTKKRPVIWNRFMEQLTGLSGADVIGKDIFDKLPYMHENGIDAILDRVLEGDKESVEDIKYYVPETGKNGYISSIYVPLTNASGEIIGVIESIHEITAKKNAEEALRKVHMDLEKAYQLQREFLNNVTHEVRTPLTAVQGYTQMLLEGVAGDVSKEQADLLKRIISSSDHLLKIVGDVLEITRIKSGRFIVHPASCNPLDVVNKAVSTILPQAQKKGLYVNIHNAANCHLKLYDEQKMMVIITNLLSNAVKFTKTGGIDVYVNCKKGGVEIIIVDTGFGIDESELTMIYDEFRQLSYPTKYKPTGFGLGLAIVATMIEALDASLAVSSVKGLGTAFTLTMPIVTP